MTKINVLVLPSDKTGVGKFRSVDPHIFLQKLYPEDFHVDIDYEPIVDPPEEGGPIETIVDELIAADKKPYVLALDRITDVRNFGAIARTAECMGVDAILLPSKGSVQVTADAVKTSAGALNRIKVCKSESLKDSLFYIQQCGLRIVACTEKSSVPLHETNLRGAVCVVMGSEKDGITQDLINLADISCKIPMPGEISSLNVGVATGMILYEKIRQEIF